MCCTLSALINQSTTNIRRLYSSRNKEQIVNIRKRKISYFILNISITLLVCRSNALNKSFSCIQNICDKADFIRSRWPLKLMLTPACPRLLDMINDFVLLRF